MLTKMSPKANNFLGKAAFLVSWLVFMISLLDPIHSAAILPSKLHCSSTVFLYKTTMEEGSLVTYERTHFEEYQVEEFLDLNLNRSSVSVFDVFKNEHTIYYNHISPSNLHAERQLILFNPKEMTCKGLRISDWLLAEMRWTMIGSRLSMFEIDAQRVDVPIGPSGMLYTLEDSLDNYRYAGTIFSLARQTKVDVFRWSGSYQTASSLKWVTIIVQVAGRGLNKLELNEPLSKLYDTAQEVGTDPSASMNIVMIGACDMRDEDASTERASPTDKDPNVDLQLDENTFCKREKTLFLIHYNFVAGYLPGSLLGSPIEELSESRYDFDREPLMMPTGIGCWNDNEALAKWQKRLTRDNPMDQLSAEYVTTRGGSRGVSFIAFDQQRNLVRLDRKGRKSVYDLIQGKSYHVGEFKEAHEILTMNVSRTNKFELESDGMVRRCVALGISDSSQIVSNELVAQQLLGLRPNSGEEHYLGSRMIDHVNYEVFEMELKGRNKQLMFEISKIGTSTNERHYLTYYAQSTAGPSAQKESLILKYIELWRFFPQNKYRFLLERVEFTEFSWQLDVEPTNDPKSQHSDSLSLSLFDFEECYQERSAQAEILIDFKRDEKVTMSEELLEDLARNRDAIAETIQKMMAQTLEISALNIVDFQLRTLENGDLLTSSKIVDLQSGLVSNQVIGFGLIFSNPIFEGKIHHTFLGRHELEECQLDSMAWSKAHFTAFCPNLAICAILEPNEELKKELVQNKEDPTHLENCYVYSFRYGKDNPSRYAARTAEMRSMLLARRTLTFDLKNGKEITEDDKDVPTYMATPRLREFKQLDAIGARLTNDASLLDGIRYSTPQEAPNSKNLNTRVHIPRESHMGAFRFCQLACQMDDLCGSFSVCVRQQKPNEYGERDDDCVLSSIRLNAERINELAQSSLKARTEYKFMLSVGAEDHAQQLVMLHDEACSLHSKDFFAEYELARTLIQLGDTKQYETNKSQSEAPLEKRHLSLDDCAGLSYENAINMNLTKVDFTYCPLDSHCVLKGDDHKGHMNQMNGYCHVYAKRLTRPYDVRLMMHMVLARHGSVDVERAKDEKGVVSYLDPLSEATRMESENLVKKLWGLDEQSCAQECNLRRMHCLAFNSCRQSGKVLCVLFSIRSPLARTSKYLPQLKVESQTYQNYDELLINSLTCDHFHLKADYLEVRLMHLLELEGAAGSLSPEVNVDRDKLLEERDNVIASEDEQRSKQEVSQLESELAGKPAENGANSAGISHASKWFHFGALLIGLLVGAVCTTYNRQIAHGFATGYSWYQIRRAHNNDRMTNRLVLNDLSDT